MDYFLNVGQREVENEVPFWRTQEQIIFYARLLWNPPHFIQRKWLLEICFLFFSHSFEMKAILFEVKSNFFNRQKPNFILWQISQKTISLHIVSTSFNLFWHETDVVGSKRNKILSRKNGREDVEKGGSTMMPELKKTFLYTECDKKVAAVLPGSLTIILK